MNEFKEENTNIIFTNRDIANQNEKSLNETDIDNYIFKIIHSFLSQNFDSVHQILSRLYAKFVNCQESFFTSSNIFVPQFFEILFSLIYIESDFHYIVICINFLSFFIMHKDEMISFFHSQFNSAFKNRLHTLIYLFDERLFISIFNLISVYSSTISPSFNSIVEISYFATSEFLNSILQRELSFKMYNSIFNFLSSYVYSPDISMSTKKSIFETVLTNFNHKSPQYSLKCILQILKCSQSDFSNFDFVYLFKNLNLFQSLPDIIYSISSKSSDYSYVNIESLLNITLQIYSIEFERFHDYDIFYFLISDFQLFFSTFFNIKYPNTISQTLGLLNKLFQKWEEAPENFKVIESQSAFLDFFNKTDFLNYLKDLMWNGCYIVKVNAGNTLCSYFNHSHVFDLFHEHFITFGFIERIFDLFDLNEFSLSYHVLLLLNSILQTDASINLYAQYVEIQLQNAQFNDVLDSLETENSDVNFLLAINQLRSTIQSQFFIKCKNL